MCLLIYLVNLCYSYYLVNLCYSYYSHLLYIRTSGFHNLEGGILISSMLPYSDLFHFMLMSLHSWEKEEEAHCHWRGHFVVLYSSTIGTVWWWWRWCTAMSHLCGRVTWREKNSPRKGLQIMLLWHKVYTKFIILK